MGTTCPAGPSSPRLSGRKSPAVSPGYREQHSTATSGTVWSCFAGVQVPAVLTENRRHACLSYLEGPLLHDGVTAAVAGVDLQLGKIRFSEPVGDQAPPHGCDDPLGRVCVLPRDRVRCSEETGRTLQNLLEGTKHSTWRRGWQGPPVFSPGESQRRAGQATVPGVSRVGHA